MPLSRTSKNQSRVCTYTVYSQWAKVEAIDSPDELFDIITPLTLLSAYLLLTKPRSAKHPASSTPMAADHA